MNSRRCIRLALIIASVISVHLSYSQDSSGIDKVVSFPDKVFSSLDKKAALAESKLDKQTERYLLKLQRRENKLKNKLSEKDSALANQLFQGMDEKYAGLKNINEHVNKYSSVYSGHLDSLTTALNFLRNQNFSSGADLQKTLSHYGKLQQKLNASEQIKKQLLEREQLLKTQFEKLGMIKELRQYQKEIYYYQEQIREYKQSFEDPSKIEAKLMESVMKLPTFKDFFAKNSMLGSLFSLPGTAGNSTASIQGLQTRALVNQTLIDRFGNTSSVTQMLQQNVQSAQSGLNQLKNKVSSFKKGNYGNSSDEDIPGFKPNTQKTKTFVQRLEYGSNMQSQKARYFFPVTSDIGLSLGYKLSDKSMIGIGASYKLGWGSNWNNIKISQQGIGLRSYLDYKIKGSFFVSGGYEQNYRALISSIDQLKNYSSWQTSGLIGLSKKYSISKKINGEIKLLWDFMSYREVPRAQPILFRIGYSLK